MSPVTARKMDDTQSRLDAEKAVIEVLDAARWNPGNVVLDLGYLDLSATHTCLDLAELRHVLTDVYNTAWIASSPSAGGAIYFPAPFAAIDDLLTRRYAAALARLGWTVAP